MLEFLVFSHRHNDNSHSENGWIACPAAVWMYWMHDKSLAQWCKLYRLLRHLRCCSSWICGHYTGSGWHQTSLPWEVDLPHLTNTLSNSHAFVIGKKNIFSFKMCELLRWCKSSLLHCEVFEVCPQHVHEGHGGPQWFFRLVVTYLTGPVERRQKGGDKVETKSFWGKSVTRRPSWQLFL